MRDELTIPRDLAIEMATVFKDAEAGTRWLQSPVPDLGGETPASLIQAGRVDEVVAVLRRFNLGLPM